MIKSDGTFHFKSTAAANLYSEEITGQISDGAWENARPLNHWQYWCGGKVVVDGTVGRTGTALRTSYSLKSLKRYIKEEMKNAIRIAKMPWFTMEFGHLTRDLTSEFAVKEFAEKGNTYYADKYFKEFKIRGREYVLENRQLTIESHMSKALKALPGEPSAEFKTALHEEIVRQVVEGYRQLDEEVARRQARDRALLVSIGVTDAATMVEKIKEITAVEVTDRELDAALDEIQTMMTNWLGDEVNAA